MGETRLVLDLGWEQQIQEFELRLREQTWIGSATGGGGERHTEYSSFGDPQLGECWLFIDPDERGRIICAIVTDTDDGDPGETDPQVSLARPACGRLPEGIGLGVDPLGLGEVASRPCGAGGRRRRRRAA